MRKLLLCAFLLSATTMQAKSFAPTWEHKNNVPLPATTASNVKAKSFHHNIMNWEDGPLTKAIKEGYSGVFTNISSAQTKVAERLNGLFDPKDTELLRHVAETSLSSKLIGPESKFFSEILVNAITSSKIMVGDTPKYSVKNINILKTHGKSVTESRLIDGYAIESTRGGMGMPLTIKNAKIALLDMNLAKFRMPPGVHIMVDNPDNLENVRQREMDVTKERCRKIIEAGANVIVCSKGIDDLALKYFVEAKCIAIRRCDKADMKRLASATGAKILITFESKDEDGEEIFNKECLGEAKEVSEEAVNDYNYVFFKK